MPALEINVSGECRLNRPAERACLSVRVAAESSSQDEAAQNATRAVNTLHEKFRALSPRTGDSHATSDAPITTFNIGSITTSSRIPTDINNIPTGPRQFSAFASLSAVFRDFAKLGQIASQLFMMPFVEVQSIDWRLTNATSAELNKEARSKALLNAIEKATLYSQVVARQVSVVEICDQGGTFPGSSSQPVRRYTMARAAYADSGAEALELEPQEIAVTASITAKFATTGWTRPAVITRY
ncbi:conserved hypothetical protein [Histoplasma capsulatum var. duboisii H88]|uniref:DUF541 domain-containing protein n=2 Tax=Ajellomyces capsulatus TaxID=5037 RepID=F0UKE4_AJEC8|nr:conserved hypothetical protein [Histoplasma capsulatum H143]EGC46725.1 conserved hypothetical protein [Histoplasma capsulatum var. duboisii H88]QSS57353.1 hypothetical protein I7I53_05803 [Histoplasma capsulatum var. duboisii H88]